MQKTKSNYEYLVNDRVRVRDKVRIISYRIGSGKQLGFGLLRVDTILNVDGEEIDAFYSFPGCMYNVMLQYCEIDSRLGILASIRAKVVVTSSLKIYLPTDYCASQYKE